ncbi:MAG: hypothetical protein KAT71_08210 [Gammaproteobacteria bacterium]|nr:hypothetical protein [Gammaproteobacteria bacterium]
MSKNKNGVANKVASNPIKRYNLEQPSQMVKMAGVLKKHIVENKLYENIKGNNYVLVEGWQFAGGLLGLTAKVINIESVGDPLKKEYKYKAEVELVHSKSGNVVGYGFALCSNSERMKSSFDEYAIASMAQTRAVGKAYRLLLGWVMKLAGYEGTPAEEMGPADDSEHVADDSQEAEVKGSEHYVALKKRLPRLSDEKKKQLGADLVAGKYPMTEPELKDLQADLL